MAHDEQHNEEGRSPKRSGGHGGHSTGHGHGHGGGGHEEGHEGAPEWLISFADNTALMMGFFVILLAMNMGPKGGTDPQRSDSQAAKESGQTPEALDWAISVREAFHNPVDMNSTNPRDRILAMRLRERIGRGQTTESGIRGTHDKSQTLKQGEIHGLVATLLFEMHSSALSEEGKAALAAAAQRLRGNLQVIEIRGHIAASENTADPSYGITLSFNRARQAADHLASLGLDRRQLRVVSVGDAELIKRRAYTSQEHARNSRVEVKVLDEIYRADAPSAQDE